ncbi:MAG: HAD-IA family hydrolase [Candidatus Micrarchaeota archaeon]|nr:HAD-IA family hydrolase [Candidatus Micrarchaeota archaeon]MDE1860015.1 HAD-IA family hydrolase [Candidatus Micrarchaeota archaeon]
MSTSTPLVRIARFSRRRYNIQNIERKSSSYTVDTLVKLREEEEASRFYDFVYTIYSKFYTPWLKDGVLDLFKALRKKGKKIAIFSDSNRYRLFIEARKLGILDKVDFVLSADSIKRYKPNPTGLMAIADKFGMRKRDCLYIGDMVVDIYTARFAGIDSCAVTDGIDPYDLLKSVNPKYISKNLLSIKNMK